MIDKNLNFFDSFSPFWILIDPKGRVCEKSLYFKDLRKGSCFKDDFQTSNSYLDQEENLFDLMVDRILKFQYKNKINFRANLHLIDEEKALLVMWPLLESLDDVKTNHLVKEMNHPAALMTDIILAKGVLKKNFEKLRDVDKKSSQVLLNNMLEGMVLQNSLGTIVDFNQAALNILSLTEEQLKGKDSRDPMWRVIKEDGSDFEFHQHPAMICLREKRQVKNIVMGIRINESQLKWIKINSSPLYKDKEIHALTTFQDITEERRQAQQFEAYAKGLNTYAIVAKTNEHGVLTFVNDQFCQVSGYSKAEAIGQTHRLVNSGYHSDEFFKSLWDTISNGDTWHGEIQNKSKNGDYYWVDTTIVPILNHENKPIEYLAFRYDITSKKKSELELQRRENTLRQLFEQSKDAQMTLRPPEWKFASANQAALDLFHVESEQEFKKLGPWSVSPEFQEDNARSDDKAKTFIEEAILFGQCSFEWLHKTIDHKLIPCTVLLSRINEDD